MPSVPRLDGKLPCELLADVGRPAATFVFEPTPEPDRAIVVGVLLALLVTVTEPVRVAGAAPVIQLPGSAAEAHSNTLPSRNRDPLVEGVRKSHRRGRGRG